MQKALTQMNVQLTHVISDIMGETGQKIIRAIVTGKRDDAKLAKFRNYRIRASEQDIAQALRGTWGEEHLFCLKQALQLFDTHPSLIQQADERLQAQLAKRERRDQTLPVLKNKGRAKNAPGFDVRNARYRWAGIDLTRSGGVDAGTAL